MTAVLTVLGEVAEERRSQDEKWGEQSHPNGTGGARYERQAIHFREECDRRHAEGEGTWADILTEEFFEALAEADVEKLRVELIHVAAVATAWVECIDRNADA